MQGQSPCSLAAVSEIPLAAVSEIPACRSKRTDCRKTRSRCAGLFRQGGLLPCGALLVMVWGNEFPKPLVIQSFCYSRTLACTPCAKRLFSEKDEGFSSLTVLAEKTHVWGFPSPPLSRLIVPPLSIFRNTYLISHELLDIKRDVW